MITDGQIAILALQMAIAESVSRQANIPTGAALQIVELAFERHAGDVPSTHSAHAILLECVDAAQDANSFIKILPPE